MRASWRFSDRELETPWTIPIPPRRGVSEYRDGARMAFYRRRNAKPERAGYALIVAPADYCGVLSSGLTVPGFRLTITADSRDAARPVRRVPDDWTPPADPMASIRARRAARAAGIDGRRRSSPAAADPDPLADW